MELALEPLVRIGAARKQEFHQIKRGQLVRMIRSPPRPVERELVGRGITHLDGNVQRSVVDVGAELDERASNVEAIVVDRHHRRRCGVAVLEIEVGAAGNQLADERVVSGASGVHQCAEAPARMVGVVTLFQRGDVRLAIDIGAGLDQHVDHVDVAFRGGPHQGRRLLERLGRVHIDAASQQQAYCGHASGSCRGQERRLTFRMRA